MNAIRWGLIGATTIGREWMVEAIREAGGSVTAVMSRDGARGKAYAEEFGIAKSATDLASLWGDVDAVYIATTNERHREECIAAAEAGKHVLCEKPLATRLEDAREMVAACRRARVVIGVNHHLRNAATHRAIREAIHAGRIGRPLAARVVHGGSLPEHLRTWRLQESSGGGGAIMDLTVHDGDLLRFLLADEAEAVSAFAQNGGLAAPDVEDAAMIQLRFASGVIAQLHDSFTTPYLRTMVEVHGTAGSITALDCMPQRPGGSVAIRTKAGEEHLKLVHENYYVRGIRAFHDAIAGCGEPVCTGEDGMRSLAIALAAQPRAGAWRRSSGPDCGEGHVRVRTNLRRSGANGKGAGAVLGVKLASQAMRRLRRFPTESLTPPRGSGEGATDKRPVAAALSPRSGRNEE